MHRTNSSPQQQTIQKLMKILAIVGPLGSGKTTFILNTLKALQSHGFDTKKQCAYIINDTGEFLDGEIASERTQVIAMTNGCFTCSDIAHLEEKLKDLKQQKVSYVFLEGFGITPGNEIKSFLLSQHCNFEIVCLLSSKHFELDLVKHSDTLRSHVASATICVGITKCSISLDDNETGLMDFVGINNPGIRLLKVRNEPKIIGPVTSFFNNFSIETYPQKAKCTHSHSCSCNHPESEPHHNHHHDNGDVHQKHLYSYALRGDTTLEQIKSIFTGGKFIRAKGAVDGRHFDMIHGDWEVSHEDSRKYLTFYTETPLTTKEAKAVSQIVLDTDSSIDPRGYAQLRNEAGISRQKTVEAIRSLLLEFPQDPLVFYTDKGIRLATHPESLQLPKEISRRPSVVEEWFPEVLKYCMEYWIKCARILIQKEDRIEEEDLGTNLREIAISIAWWINRYSFEDTIVKDVASMSLGRMAVKGSLLLKRLNSDPERAYWQCLELVEVFKYGSEKENLSEEEIIPAIKHCLSLAHTKELRDLWQAKIKELRKLITL